VRGLGGRGPRTAHLTLARAPLPQKGTVESRQAVAAVPPTAARAETPSAGFWVASSPPLRILSWGSYCVRMAIWTIEQLIDDGMTLTAYCHAPMCHHNQRLDINKLRDKLGPDAPAMSDDLVPKLRCIKCGGRKVGLIYTPPEMPGNPFMRPKG
jgi:hypothetical protein